MKVSAGIVTYNSEGDVIKCIESIFKYTEGLDFTLYVSDNCSSDQTVSRVREQFPQVVVLENAKNGGYGYGNNKVISKVKSDYHVVINPDIELKENTIKILCDYLEAHQNVAMVTPKILNKDDTEQFLPKRNPRFSYVVLSKLPGLKKFRRKYTRQDENLKDETSIELCTGCFFAARTSVLREMRGFSREFYMYFEDADLSRRVKSAGYDIIFYPHTGVYHDWHRDNTHSAKGISRFLNSMMKYFKKWGLK